MGGKGLAMEIYKYLQENWCSLDTFINNPERASAMTGHFVDGIKLFKALKTISAKSLKEAYGTE